MTDSACTTLALPDTEQHVSSTLDYALDYASKGWAVFPCHTMTDHGCSCGKADCHSPAKHPKTDSGCKNATADCERIRQWFTSNNSNIGIATGAVSGIWVLDIDVKSKGDETLNGLLATHTLPETVTVATGGGGWHYYFRYPSTCEVKNRTNVLPGINVRGNGGYVIAPPSNHKSGNRYQWRCPPSRTEIADAPQWLLDLIMPPAPQKAEPDVDVIEFAPIDDRIIRLTDTGNDYEGAVRYVSKIAGVSEGERNGKAFNIAGHLWANFPTLTGTQVIDVLQEWNERNNPPLDDTELTGCVRSSLRNGTPRVPTKPTRNRHQSATSTAPKKDKLIFTRASEIVPKPLRWLWDKRIPLGRSTLLIADMGTGKSMFICDMAARITTGKCLPLSEDKANAGDVVMFVEDAEDDVYRRLSAAGADLDHVYLFSMRQSKESFSFVQNCDLVADALDQFPNARLLVIDTLGAFAGKVKTNTYEEMYAALNPINDMIKGRNVSFIGTTHTPKHNQSGKAVHAAIGSVATMGAVDSAYLITRDKKDTDVRLFAAVKQRNVKLSETLTYRIYGPEGEGRIEWLGADSRTADELCSEPTGTEKLDRAKEFLTEYLSDGAKPSDRIFEDAKARGIKTDTLYRAKDNMGIIAEKNGYQGPWMWRLKASAAVANNADDDFPL